MGLFVETGTLQPEVTADLASACLGTGLVGECGGEDSQIDQRPQTKATNTNKRITSTTDLPHIGGHMDRSAA